MTTRPCVGCPFRRDCPDCPWSGGIPAAATEPAPVSGVASGKIGSKQDGSQPRCVNTSTGSLTADSTPAIPGGISG
jgi:hypothetical protein